MYELPHELLNDLTYRWGALVPAQEKKTNFRYLPDGEVNLITKEKYRSADISRKLCNFFKA